jgi:hypothetical protein
MAQSTITSLAILTVEWESGKTALDRFEQVVAYCIKEHCVVGEPIKTDKLKAIVYQEAGINIPSAALLTILKKCSKNKYIKKQNAMFFPNKNELEKIKYKELKTKAEKNHNKIASKLQAYAQNKFDRQWTLEEADDFLLIFIQENQASILAATSEGDPVPSPGKKSQRANYIVGSFVDHISKNDIETFDCLATVVQGYVLSGVLFYPDSAKIDARLDTVSIYLDTPIIKPVLGLGSPSAKEEVSDLINLLSSLGAKIFCFEHTRNELIGVLENESTKVRKEPQNVDHDLSSSEIQEMIINIDNILNKYNINISSKPAWTPWPDDAALMELFQEIKYPFDNNARQNDVDSVSSVARIRGNNKVVSFESLKAAFITNNEKIVKLSSKFFHSLESGGAFPVCFSIETMIRLAWFKKPMSAPDIAKHRIMALSYAAMAPSQELLKKYNKEIKKLSKRDGEDLDKRYSLMRSNRETRTYLMDKTQGDEKALTVGTLEEMIREATKKETASEKQKTYKEQQKNKKLLKDLKDEKDKSGKITSNLYLSAKNKAEKWSRLISWIFAGVLAILGIFLLSMTLSYSPVTVNNGFLKATTWGGAGILVVVSLVFGFNIKDYRRHFKEQIYNFILSREKSNIDNIIDDT